MASARSSRTAKPSHGAMAYAPYIDERGRRHEPVDESRNYNPGAEASDSEDEDDAYIPPSPKRRRIVPSVSLHSRTGQSVEVRIPPRNVQPTQAEASPFQNVEMPPPIAVQKPKRFIEDFFAPLRTPGNRASTTSTLNGRAAPNIVPDQGPVRQGNPAVAEEDEEELDSRKKRATEVAKARATKAKLEATYEYDYELDAAGSKRWFILCSSSKTSTEKINVRKELVPRDRRLFVEWTQMPVKERKQYNNLFENFLKVKVSGFMPKPKEE